MVIRDRRIITYPLQYIFTVCFMRVLWRMKIQKDAESIKKEQMYLQNSLFTGLMRAELLYHMEDHSPTDFHK